MQSARPLRYRSSMRKPIAKLVLCKETIRALINTDLARVIGGQGDVALANGGSLDAKTTCAAAARPVG